MKRKVVVTCRWLEPPPIGRNGKPTPKNQWSRKRRRSWVVRWYTADGRRRQRSFCAKLEAEEYAAARQAEFDRNPAARRTPKKIALGQFIDEILDVQTRPRGQKLTASSIRETRKAMRKLVSFLGYDFPFNEICPADAVRFVAALRTTPHSRLPKRKLSAATINKITRTIKAAFNIAVRQLGYLDVSPFANISQEKLSDQSKRYVSPNEFGVVLEACAALADEKQALWWRTFVSLLHTTGLRLNEAMHLTWADTDFERDEVRVIARDGLLSFQPKGKRSRSIPVPRQTMDLLATMQLNAEAANPYVFIPQRRLAAIQDAKDAGLWRSTREPLPGLRSTWAEILKRARVKRATFHDLRRSAITNWARRIPAQVTQRLAGHVSITTTMQYYVSVLDDDMAAAREAADDAIESATGTQDALGTH
jgi:integrase